MGFMKVQLAARGLGIYATIASLFLAGGGRFGTYVAE